jgi:DNA-binding response OmpR family regulator
MASWRLLLLESDARLRQVLESDIRAAGFEVEGVGTEADALQRLQREPRPACLCIDVHGLTRGFFERLPAGRSGGSILLLEAWRATQGEASPFTCGALIQAVKRSLERHSTDRTPLHEDAHQTL